jgi:hypothetical protein
MRWKNESSQRPLFLDYIFAKEIVYNAYREGYINYNTFKAAVEKIATNLNGDWMFENGRKIYMA